MRGDEHDPVASRTLAVALRADALTIGDAVRIAGAVAEEVAALHAAGRAHGGIGPDSVVLDGDAVSLAGPLASTTGLAAPSALRDADLEGTGVVLAAALGWDDGPVPAPIERLLARAREADAPASALALTLRRLQQDPITIAGLLPPAPAADERVQGLGSLLGLLVPTSDRRSTGVAAAVLGGVVALGAVLLLTGTPGTTVAPPQAVEAAVVAPVPATSPAVAAAAPLPTSVGPLPRPAKQRVLQPTQQREVVAVEVAGPTAPPSPTATSVPTGAQTTSAAPTPAPSVPVASPPVTAAPSPSSPPNPPTPAPAPAAPPVTAPVSPSSAPVAPPSTSSAVPTSSAATTR